MEELIKSQFLELLDSRKRAVFRVCTHNILWVASFAKSHPRPKKAKCYKTKSLFGNTCLHNKVLSDAPLFLGGMFFLGVTSAPLPSQHQATVPTMAKAAGVPTHHEDG